MSEGPRSITVAVMWKVDWEKLLFRRLLQYLDERR